MTASHSHHAHHDAPHSSQRGTWLQRFLSNRLACIAASAVIVLAIRFALVHWALVGGYPSETMIANVLGMLFGGILIGGIEGRMHLTHKQNAQVMGIALETFLERPRLALIMGSFLAILIATFLELGSALAKINDVSGIAFFVGVGLLSLLTGVASLWLAFSWSRWCFGEVHWN